MTTNISNRRIAARFTKVDAAGKPDRRDPHQQQRREQYHSMHNQSLIKQLKHSTFPRRFESIAPDQR
jgi:hypothetical protein